MLPKIEVPTFDVEIPSTKQKVKMRCMKVREEKLLLMARQGNDPTEILSAIRQVVNNCLVTEVNMDQLALFDLEYLFLKLRAQSISDKAEVSYIDNDEVATEIEKLETETMQEEAVNREIEKIRKKATRTFTIDLNSIKVEFPEGSDNTIQVNNKVGIVLRYPPASLYSDENFLKSSTDQLVDMLITKSIEKIYDGETIIDPSKEDPEKLKDWINDLDPKTHEKIEKFFSQLPHLRHVIKYTNKNGKEREIVLSTLNDFFLFA